MKGKRRKKDVAEFNAHLMDNLIFLHEELRTFSYRHGGYTAFKIFDPKPRDIHKASVRDRLLHHAIHRVLYPYFDKKFIFDSYSSRLGKGTHRAVNRLRALFYKASRNNTATCWVLKCDVRKFFASIDHGILLSVLRKFIADQNIFNLLQKVIGSLSCRGEGVGLPLGNLTSQLFVNIYLNELDRFIKHKLKVKYYLRFADDFVILDAEKERLEKTLKSIEEYLRMELRLELHPKKVSIGTFAAGVDFLGTVNFVGHRIMRTNTKRRMFRKLSQRQEDLVAEIIDADAYDRSLQSYLGILKHLNGYKLRQKLLKINE